MVCLAIRRQQLYAMEALKSDDSRNAPNSSVRGERLRLIHVITGLPVGGAQTVLVNQVRHQRQRGWDVAVCSLTEVGEIGERLREDGVDVLGLGMNRSLPSPLSLWRLRQWLKAKRPDAVQTWLYHGDLIGGLAARWAGVPRVFWNLRQTDLDPAGSRRSTIMVSKLCAWLSRRVPDRIVCCAEAARSLHAGLGYDETRMLVIGNGIDSGRIKPDDEGAARVREELGLSPDVPLVGLVARFHPQKDHAGFLAAVAELQRRLPETHALMCGEDVVPQNATLADWIARLPAPDRVHCLGIRRDLTAIYSALDVAVSSSSFGEGFSNVIIEAMACATPCVVTDVGDSALIVGETGWTVPPRDSAALADTVSLALAMPAEARAARGREARQRVLESFRLDDVHAAYDALYLDSMAP